MATPAVEPPPRTTAQEDGNAIHLLRAHRRWSLYELAQRTNLPPSRIWKIEAGQREATPDEARIIWTALASSSG